MAFTRFAVARFTLFGEEHALEAYWLQSYGNGLFLPFADATSGDETYGAGRYLLDTVKGADLGTQDGRLVLDFNLAYNPSCAYDAALDLSARAAGQPPDDVRSGWARSHPRVAPAAAAARWNRCTSRHGDALGIDPKECPHVPHATRRRARMRSRDHRRRAAARPPTCRSGRPAGSGATRCRRATRSARMSFAGTTRLRGRRLRHAAAHRRRRRHLDRPARRHVRRTSPRSRRSTPTRSSPAAAASRGAPTTAARRSRASPFTPVESSCREPLAAAGSSTPSARLPRPRRRHRPADDRRRRELRARRRDPGHARPAAARRRPTSCSLSDDDGLRRDVRRQDLPDRRRRRRRGSSSATPSRAVRGITFVDATDGYAVGDGVAVPAHDRRRRDVDGAGHRRRRAAGPDADPLRDATSVRRDDRSAATQLVRTTDGGETLLALVDAVDRPDVRRGVRVADAASSPAAQAGRDRRLRRRGPDVRAGRRPARRAASRASAPAPARRRRSRPAPTARSPARPTAARPGRAATSRRPRTSSTSRSRRRRRLRARHRRRAVPHADGGATWRTLDTGSTARPRAVYAPTRRPSWSSARPACGARPTAAAAFDAVARRRGRARAARAASTAPARRVVAYGAQDVIRSADAGETWTAVASPAARRRRAQPLAPHVDFVDARNGFLLDDRGRAVPHRATAAGAGPSCRASARATRYGMAFSSAARGYLVISRFGDVRERSGSCCARPTAARRGTRSSSSSDADRARGVARRAAATDYLLGGDASAAVQPHRRRRRRRSRR